nr:NAD+ synthase [bacterium]
MTRLAVMQQRPKIGDIDHNTALIVAAMRAAKDAGALAVVTPELFMVGYPPKDILLESLTMTVVDSALSRLCKESALLGVDVLVGAPSKARGRRFYNSVYLISNGTVIHRWDKQLLPFYDVFDDPRYFVSGKPTDVVVHRGIRWGVMICEDAWADMYPDDYTMNPITQLALQAPDCVIIPTASPFEVDKTKRRFSVLSALAKRVNCPVLMVNQVGGQDDVVYAGSSMLLHRTGSLLMQCPDFWEGVAVCEWQSDQVVSLRVDTPVAQRCEAIQMGIRDYVRSHGVQSVLIGISGGIDSAVTAVLATQALGCEWVHGVLMPSDVTSQESERDARLLAQQLGIALTCIPIQSMVDESLRQLPIPITGTALENIQARIRGCLLMTMANQLGGLVLTTGNKSEYAMGYCTLYGDMVGGFAPLKDVYKTQVYEMASYLNQQVPVIPGYTIERPPTAELRDNQFDTDSLPPYDTLDPILSQYIEHRASVETVISSGTDPDLATWVYDAIHRVEYKRHQSAHGIKLSHIAFGSGRRMPITGRVPR